jgi:hypothetical protein
MSVIVIRWENDERDVGSTWQELLDHVRDTQWYTYESEAEFRADMASRAFNWSLTEIDTGGTAEQFFRELKRARVIRIERDPSPMASS